MDLKNKPTTTSSPRGEWCEGKTIIITGAARIGQDIAKELKNRGANLVITYFKDPLEAGPFGFGVQADVSKKEDVERVVEETKKKFGHIDALIHMAAIYEASAWENLDENHWDKNMNVIAKSSYLFGKMVGDQMQKNQGDIKGKMIFFSDWSVLSRPYKDYLPYNAAKSAVVGLTKSFAKELAPHILVNAIAPGPMLRPPDLTDQENEEVLAGTLLKRWGGAQEITKGVLYLLEADFVTATILTIDGGRTIA
jgi:NAD(P)-dependent dehydrogenase (short-subunit alcohol dehydrogenase family)